ncbi:MAG: hypothetical protein ACLQVN_07640 [Bryobacteraceae bacterium]
MSASTALSASACSTAWADSTSCSPPANSMPCLHSLGRFSEKYAVLGTHTNGESVITRTRSIGPALIFERLWQECGAGPVLHGLLRDRHFEFPVERAVFLTVLHRLVAPGSDRAAEKWKQDYAISGVDSLALHQLYRAMAWLGDPLPESEQNGATPFVVRTTKDLVEEELFARRRDLFTGLDLVFFDTTSIYFEGEGGQTLGWSRTGAKPSPTSSSLTPPRKVRPA